MTGKNMTLPKKGMQKKSPAKKNRGGERDLWGKEMAPLGKGICGREGLNIHHSGGP